ncbi:MAG TPA: glycosyltransferase family 2 protein, partial [Candidatus Eisenbacteria bacterium]|nr:glycosyltransferase family 2 protein [Candidatus Eisenbacteria bacterium]
LRIIVVDNGSSDSSCDIVRRVFPRVELIVNESNLLFAEGNNVGIRRAMELEARFVLLLNNDTVVDPDFALPLIEAMRKDDSVGIAGPQIRYFDDPERIWYGGGEFHPLIWVPRHRDIRKSAFEAPGEAGETAYVTGCALMFRSELAREIGLLDPSYGMYCEDVDFCLRAAEAGWKCRYEPSSVVWHKVSSSSGGGFTPYKLEHRLSSTYRLFRRFKPLWWRILLLPLHAAAILLLLLALLATGRWGLLGGAMRGLRRIARTVTEGS